MQIYNPLRFLGDRAADHIANGQRVMSLAIALSELGQGIGHLTTLGDRKDERLVVDRWIAVTKFTGVFHGMKESRLTVPCGVVNVLQRS